MLRKRCGICEQLQTARVLLALRYSATTPRVSIEAGASRWLTRRVSTRIPPSALVCSTTLPTSALGGCIPINSVDASMTVGAAYYRHMKHARNFDIIDVGRLTRNQSRVFSPLDRRSKHSCNTHLCTYPFSSRETEYGGNLEFWAFEITPRRPQAQLQLSSSAQRQTGPRVQCSDSQCSGRYFPRDPYGSRPLSGWDYF